jgi:hypothetical protein
MGEIKLSTPRLRVLRDGHDPLEVQVINADLVRWDRTRFKHKWPPMSEAPFLGQTFLAWCAARRIGAIPSDLTYETWEELSLEVIEAPNDDDAAGGDQVPGGPTPEDPESG